VKTLIQTGTTPSLGLPGCGTDVTIFVSPALFNGKGQYHLLWMASQFTRRGGQPPHWVGYGRRDRLDADVKSKTNDLAKQ